MHLPTLITLSLLINLVIGIYIFVLYRRKPKSSCFLYWALSCFSFVFGGIAAALRDFDYPYILTYFLADLLLVAAPLFVFMGLIQFSRFRYTRKRRAHAMRLALIITIALLISHPFPQVINMLSAIALAFLFWMCSQLLAKSVFNEPVYTRMLRSIFLIHGAIILTHAVLMLLGDNQLTQMGLPDSTVFILLSHIMLTTLTALLLPWLSFLKLERILTLKSQRDGLTNLANRSHFYASVERHWARYPSESVVIMMIDIDHFKAVNDKFGHSIGDKVIKDVSNVLSKELRSHNLIGRIGGEEFAVLIQNENITIGKEIGQRLLKQVETSMAFIDSRKINLTISIGMTEARPEHHELLSAFKVADNALYESKRLGRNILTVANIDSSLS